VSRGGGRMAEGRVGGSGAATAETRDCYTLRVMLPLV